MEVPAFDGSLLSRSRPWATTFAGGYLIRAQFFRQLGGKPVFFLPVSNSIDIEIHRLVVQSVPFLAQVSGASSRYTPTRCSPGGSQRRGSCKGEGQVLRFADAFGPMQTDAFVSMQYPETWKILPERIGPAGAHTRMT